MVVFYRLFSYCVHSSTRSTPSSSNPTEPATSLDRNGDRLFLIWWAAFGLSLFFRPVAELALRLLLFSACALLIGTLQGSLNLLAGHAVLRAIQHAGYEPSIQSSLEAGALGGVIVMGPVIIAVAFLIALLGDSKLQKSLSSSLALLAELALAVAVSTAAASIGALIAHHVHIDKGPPLDTTHAARAGALGACILTVPAVSTAALLMPQMQAFAFMPNEPAPVNTVDNHCILPFPIHQRTATPRTTRPRKPLIVHTTAETVGYVLVTLCILTIRLLCL